MSHAQLDMNFTALMAEAEDSVTTITEDNIGPSPALMDGSLPGESEHVVSRDPLGGHTCHTCGKSFPSRSAGLAHLRTHSQARPFPCSQCQMRFRDNSTLQQHMRRHTGERPYRCEVKNCGKAFKQKSQLDQHTRLHTGERPYSCMHCGKTFVQKNHVDRHIRTHTGEKPYECGVCGACYIDKSSLNFHSKKHGMHSLMASSGARFAGRRSGRPRKPQPQIIYAEMQASDDEADAAGSAATI